MEKRSGHAVQVMGEKNGVLASTGKLTLLLAHPNIKGKNVSIIAVTGDDTDHWKSFILNSMMKYLDCEGAGSWFNSAWKTRTRNIFHDELCGPRSSGIYFWSEPYLVENSAGDESVILLMDVVDNEPGSPFMSLATLMSSTLISTSVEFPNLNLFDAIAKVYDPGCPITVKSRLEQFIPIIFNAQSQTGLSFGANSEFYSRTDTQTQNEGNSFMKLLNKTQFWFLPEQQMIDNENTISLGKEFTRHYKKLFGDSIFDTDDIPYINRSNANSESELLNYLLGSFQDFQKLVETGFFKKCEENVENTELDCTSSTDVEMTDLSQSSPLPVRPDRNRLSPPQDVIQHSQLGFADNNSTEHQSRNVNAALTCTKFDGNLTEAHASCLNKQNQSTRQLSNQEMDELFQNFIKLGQMEYTSWLNAHPCTEMTKSSVEKEFEEYLRDFFEKLKEFCQQHSMEYEERVKTCCRTMRLQFQNAKKSRTSKLSKDEVVKSLQSLVEELLQKYSESMELCFQTAPSQLQECHQNNMEKILNEVVEFCKRHYLENAVGLKNDVRKTIEEKFVALEVTAKELTIKMTGLVQGGVEEYSVQMRREMSQLVSRSFTLEHFRNINQDVLKRVTPRIGPLYQNCILDEMRKQTRTTVFRFQSVAESIFKYNTEMRKFFDMYTCFSTKNFNERSNKIKSRLLSEYQSKYNDIDLELLQIGLSVVERSAAAHNKEIQENVTKEGDFALTHVKNFYNAEMKSRLESNIFQSQELRSMHEKLKKDCLLAFTDSCHAHDGSGIPDKKNILCGELDTCFMAFSNSNDSKLEKSTRTISAAIRKFKFEFVNTIERKISQKTYSPKDFKSLTDGTIAEVCKLLEIEVRKIPFEDVNVHKDALRKSVEIEIPDLRTENEKKWDIQEDARKKIEEAEKVRKNKEEADRKKKEKEEKQRKDKEDTEKKAEERRIRDREEEERKKAMEEENRKKIRNSSSNPNRTRCDTSNSEYGQHSKLASPGMANSRHSAPSPQSFSNSNTDKHQYVTTNSEYGKYSTSANATVGTTNPGGDSFSTTDQTDNFTIAIEFQPTKIIVGVITIGDEFRIIPNERGENQTLNVFGFNDKSKVIYGVLATSTDGTGFHSADTIFNTKKVEKSIQIRLKGDKVFDLTTELEGGIMLSQMKRNAEAYLKRSVFNVVITVPLWFNSKQRRQMKDSAIIAGFSHVFLINETSAVALALSMDASRKNSSNDILVVVKNERCDAAVYSYSMGQVKMISNSGDEQLTSKGFKEYLLGRDDDKEIIKLAVEKAGSKYKDRKFIINESALIANKDETNISKHMRSHGILLHLKGSNYIIGGAALLARKITLGQKNPVKDLCTLEFYGVEGKKRNFKIIPSQHPCPNQQDISFGVKNNVEGVEAKIFQGTHKIGVLSVKKPNFDSQGQFGIVFKLNNEGILDEIAEKGDKALHLDVTWDKDNLEPRDIHNLHELVESLHD